MRVCSYWFRDNNRLLEFLWEHTKNHAVAAVSLIITFFKQNIFSFSQSLFWWRSIKHLLQRWKLRPNTHYLLDRCLIGFSKLGIKFSTINFYRYHCHLNRNKAKKFSKQYGFRLLSLHSLLFPAFFACTPNWLMENSYIGLLLTGFSCGSQ